jgi:alanine transaminase
LQVAALTEYPELINTAKDAFPPDVIERAQELLTEIGSIGAYSHSQGVPFIRKSVAKFIEGARNLRAFVQNITDSSIRA